MRYSQCFTSLAVLYTVYFVVHCCDLCGVLMYLFVLFQLCKIYNEKKKLKENHSHPEIMCAFFYSIPATVNI